MDDGTFDAAMRRLEEIIERLESGQAPLEESMTLYEEGVRLAAACSKKLEQAEQKLTTLDEALARQEGEPS